MQTYSCLVCGKEYEPYRKHQKYCSVLCRNRVDKNDRRFGGIREYILERDGCACVGCGETRGLTVHHKDFVRWNNDPQNLVTLCRKCHGKIEHPNNNKPNGEKVHYCVICNNGFHPIRDSQKLCRREACRAEWKKINKRTPHASVKCVVCDAVFVQKHSSHFCCSKKCSRKHNNEMKVKGYYDNREHNLERQKRYYEKNKEKIKAYVTEWRKQNPDKVAEYYNR